MIVSAYSRSNYIQQRTQNLQHPLLLRSAMCCEGHTHTLN